MRLDLRWFILGLEGSGDSISKSTQANKDTNLWDIYSASKQTQTTKEEFYYLFHILSHQPQQKNEVNLLSA